jgi:Trk K+ transport system NAD-binding subunit
VQVAFARQAERAVQRAVRDLARRVRSCEATVEDHVLRQAGEDEMQAAVRHTGGDDVAPAVAGAERDAAVRPCNSTTIRTGSAEAGSR